jgi:very-short-patch-repair endonuclease
MNIDETTLPLSVQSANSYSDLCRCYSISDNGKGRRFLKKLIVKNGLSTNHWDWHKKLRKYPLVEKECPVCHNNFLTQIGHRDEKTVCSQKCSNTYFSDRRHTPKSCEKTSNSVKNYYLSIGKVPLTKTEYVDGKRINCSLFKIKCQVCGEEKKTRDKTQRFCSNKCSAKYRNNDPIYKQHLIEGVRKAVKEGRHKGWVSRNILSYPEKFFITVLNNNGIKFIANKPFLSYFLDFAIEDKMVDLEIDGKQHKYPERKTSDAARDEVLTKNGWRVYRIEWNSINAEEGKWTMKEKIDKFLEFYKKLQFGLE